MTYFLDEAKNGYDGAFDAQSGDELTDRLKAAQVAALVSIAESLATIAKEAPYVGQYLSRLGTTSGPAGIADSLAIMATGQTGQTERLEAAESRIAELTAQVETLTAVVEDLAGFDADEVTNAS